jgi:hypothetical protein
MRTTNTYPLERQDMPKRYDTLRQNETPFKVIEMGPFEVQLYWSRGGVNGWQVVTLCWHTAIGLVWTYKTAGGGYCKESASLEYCFGNIGKMPKGHNLGGSSISNAYRVGGNFYRVPKSAIRKARYGV